MKSFMGKFFSVRFVMGIFVLSYIFIVALIATQCYISELKSDVAQHAMTQYISENGWAEQVVSLKCALTGDDNERCIIINYVSDELRYEYFYFFGAHEKTSGISAPFVFDGGESINIKGEKSPRHFREYYVFWESHDLHSVIYPYDYYDYISEPDVSHFKKVVLKFLYGNAEAYSNFFEFGP